MPAPMLTGPVDEEFRMSGIIMDQQPTKDATPQTIPEPRNRNDELMEYIFRGRLWRVRADFVDEIDVNYQSKTRLNRTAPMLAAVKRQQDVMYGLFKAAFTRGKWPTLSMLDDNGDTISSLAEKVEFSRRLNEILRLFVAVACCECTKSTRCASTCRRIARKGSLKGSALQSTEPGCRWGRALRCLEWSCPGKECELEQTRARTFLEEIDARVEGLKACDTSACRARRQRMLSEWVKCEIFFG